MTLQFHELAERDVLEARRWYAQAPLSIQAKFETEFREICARIAQTPLRFPVVKSDVRRGNLSNFPYHVLFQLKDNAVRIIALRHHRRHPNFGLDRR